METNKARPQMCAKCGKSTGDLTEVVNPQDPQKTMWVCDSCVKQGYVLATYARMKNAGELRGAP